MRSMTRQYAVATITIVALVLRLWGINHEIYTDENKVVSPSVKLAQGKQVPLLYPKGSYYPHLYHYVLGLAFLPPAIAGSPYPSIDSSVDIYTYIARLITALTGTATVYVVYKIGTKIAGLPTGLMAAAFVTTLPLHVKYSHYAHVDIPLTLLMAGALWAALYIRERGLVRWYVLTGVFTGLSGATHYTGFVVGITLPIAHVAWASLQRLSLKDMILSKKLMVGLIAIPVSFFIASPFTIIKGKEAYDIYRQLSLRGAAGDLGYTRPDLLWPLYTQSPDWGLPFTVSGLVWEFNPLMVALAGIGLILAAYKRNWLVVGLLGGTAITMYLAIIGRLPLYAIKRLLPLTPLLTVLAAYTLGQAAVTFKKYHTLSVTAACLVFGLIVVQNGYQDIGFDTAYAGASTHSQAIAWALKNIPHGSTVLQHGPIRLLDWENQNYKTIRLREVYANFNAADPEVSHDRAKPLSNWVKGQDVDYIAMDSRIVDRYFDTTSIKLYPQTTASYQTFYNDIRSRGTLVFKVEPRLWHAAGPRVEIYDVQQVQ
ncbi:MAG: glycosyltransferase family 39 protein [Candidatus Andersenbacteria bacterium]|nr:glycosyltransferase family 39 protein [Candidatus Andersenbacteria bacterium]